MKKTDRDIYCRSIVTFAARYPQKLPDLIDMGALLYVKEPEFLELLIKLALYGKDAAKMPTVYEEEKTFIEKARKPSFEGGEEAEVAGIKKLLHQLLKDEVMQHRFEEKQKE